MPVTHLDPAGLPQSHLFHTASITSGSRFLHVSGQVGADPDTGLVATGLEAQVERCVLNLAIVLAEAGVGFEAVARMTAYFVDWTPDKVVPYEAGVRSAAEHLGIEMPTPPLTGIGVAALATPEIVVEMDLVAVLD